MPGFFFAQKLSEGPAAARIFIKIGYEGRSLGGFYQGTKIPQGKILVAPPPKAPFYFQSYFYAMGQNEINTALGGVKNLQSTKHLLEGKIIDKEKYQDLVVQYSWNQLEVVVSSQRLRGLWNGQVAAELTVAELERQMEQELARLQSERPDDERLQSVTPRLDLHGGVGVFVANCQASFRDFTIEPWQEKD